MAVWCCTSADLDYNTVKARTKREGTSFLTITLPNFGKEFEKALDQGYVDHTLFRSFRFKGGLPQFLGGFLDRIFVRSSGLLLDEPDTVAILSIRQLTLMFGKIFLPCSEERVRKAVDGYIECEQEIKRNDANLTHGLLSDFESMSFLLFGDVISCMDSDVYTNNLTPKHGPGKTADRLSGNRKFDQTQWTQRLERIFPFGEYAISGWGHYYVLDRVDFLEPDAEIPVRVTPVPKTLKAPRLIAIEPTCMQYMQQALFLRLVAYLESSKIQGRFNPVHGMIGFSKQEPNQLLAREGSLSGDLATLDLSEASDRVSNLHVKAMFARFPWLNEGVQACRSLKADVPDYGVQTLVKFASMGSALTFPIEAMVFLTLVFMGIQSKSSKPLTRRDIKSFRGRVRIYGDDIIVPVEYVRPVIHYLELFGYKINKGKSFWTGKFRESCGKEYYDGDDVSIVRCRQVLPTSLAEVPELVSTVSMRNQFYLAGMYDTVAYLDELVGKILPHYPTVHPSSPALGRWSLFEYDTSEWSKRYQRPMVWAYVVSSPTPASKVSGEGAMLKCLLNYQFSALPSVDSKHLEFQGRPVAVNIKLRKVSPY